MPCTSSVPAEVSTAPLSLDFIAEPNEADVRDIYTAVRSFNQRVTGIPKGTSFAVMLRDEAGSMQGAVSGSLWANSLHINVLWVSDSLRGQGSGTQLMRAAEEHARNWGARLSYVETLSFQARPFYERLGYEVFGELPEIADGVTLYFLRKSLAPIAPS
jgi:GNAT superfamily N-acetyltransferase